MNDRWQSESTDGRNVELCFLMFFRVVAVVALVASPPLLDVVWCSAAVAVVRGD